MSFAQTILPPKERSGWYRWGIAALIVVAVHVALLLAYLVTRTEERPPGAPPDAVMIDLAPVAVAPPPQDEVDTPPQPDQVQPDTPPPPTPNIPPPPDTPPPPTTDTTAPLEPDVQPAPQAEVVMSAPPPPPPPKPVVEKTTKTPKPTHHLPKPQRRIKSTRSDLRHAQQQAAPMAGLQGAAIADWKSEIVMRIMSEKEYPEEARAQGLGGTALVAFSVSRGGGIRGVRLARSAGSSILDRAAVATVQRANPVPPAPPGVNGGAFTVPIHFSAGR
jgi:periplasmic protein TonB